MCDFIIDKKDYYCLNCILYKNELTSMMEDEVLKVKCPLCGTKEKDIKGSELIKILYNLKQFLNSVKIEKPEPENKIPTRTWHCMRRV